MTGHCARGVFHQPGQEDQSYADLSDDQRAKLRRGAPAARLAAIDGRTAGRHTGQLEARRRRNHRPIGLGRAGQTEIPWRLEGAKALPAFCTAAALTGRT